MQEGGALARTATGRGAAGGRAGKGPLDDGKSVKLPIFVGEVAIFSWLHHDVRCQCFAIFAFSPTVLRPFCVLTTPLIEK